MPDKLPPSNNPLPPNILELPKEEEPIETVAKDTKFEKALNHIEDIQNFVIKFSGKPGYNPFMWIEKHVGPLLRQYGAGDRSDMLLNAMLGLKKVEPVAPNISVERIKTNPLLPK